jgi:hypothetical protein
MKADSEPRRRRNPFFENRYERAKIVLVWPDTVFEWNSTISSSVGRYVVCWQLAELGVKCDVEAPTLVPVKAAQVKTIDAMLRRWRALLPIR